MHNSLTGEHQDRPEQIGFRRLALHVRDETLISKRGALLEVHKVVCGCIANTAQPSG